MSKASLFCKTLYRDLPQFLILSVLTFFLTMMCLSVLCGIDQTTYLPRIFRASGLENKITYTLMEPFLYDYPPDIHKTEMDTELLSIQSVPGVASAEPGRTCWLQNEKFAVQLLFYDISALQSLKYPLSEGYYPNPDEPNRMILPQEYSRICQVGDTINLFYVTDETAFLKEQPSVKVYIAGFLKGNVSLSFGTTSPNLQVANMITANPNIGFTYGLIDENGNRLYGDYSNYIFITPEEGVDLEVLSNKLTEIVRSKSHVHTGDQLVDRYLNEISKTVSELFVLLLSFFCLGFAVLIAGTFLALVNKRKEMAVWFISGLSWKDAIFIVMAPKMFAALIGYWTALYTFVRLEGIEVAYSLIADFRWSYLLISLGVIGIMVLIGVLPFYMTSVRKSPLDLFRKD
ncbi:MAG: EscU/YscU/HrcU family type III secretion system export apparatus switch protein [Clostridiaceae bacterium]|nr:EscU/YscU/HrcU family type III secretion system export apparatus switch protein [Clostridiaceae bacterium]